jgi:hypothetical protein
MDADRRKPAGKSFLDVVVGLEAGVLGGLGMLVWFALVMPLLGQPWYLMPNLFAARFYADRNVLLSPGLATFTGAAWLILSGGIVGIVNGLLTPGGRLFGLAVAGSWYVFSYLFVWKRLAPLLLVYVPQPVLIVGFLVYGSVIGWHPQLLTHVRRSSLTE